MYRNERGVIVLVREKNFREHQHKPSLGGNTLPEVVDGSHRPYPGAPQSFPPRSQPSYLTEKLASGRNEPHFDDTASQQSARPNVDFPTRKPNVAGVTRPNASTDVFRDAKRAWGREGPSTSPYDKDYLAYKAASKVDTQTGEEYHKFRQTYNTNMPLDIKNNKDKYGGKPTATPQWHQEGYEKASNAA
ncbi:uncharacterized protein PG998_006349 [Apiospora kogelbergensis]|uniref:uncharacterized protein n=1 Tax=Apiospora kogelbergensis TaxID=1337665 RepID=UPI00312CFA6D